MDQPNKTIPNIWDISINEIKSTILGKESQKNQNENFEELQVIIEKIQQKKPPTGEPIRSIDYKTPDRNLMADLTHQIEAREKFIKIHIAYLLQRLPEGELKDTLPPIISNTCYPPGISPSDKKGNKDEPGGYAASSSAVEFFNQFHEPAQKKLPYDPNDLFSIRFYSTEWTQKIISAATKYILKRGKNKKELIDWLVTNVTRLPRPSTISNESWIPSSDKSMFLRITSRAEISQIIEYKPEDWGDSYTDRHLPANITVKYSSGFPIYSGLRTCHLYLFSWIEAVHAALLRSQPPLGGPPMNKTPKPPKDSGNDWAKSIAPGYRELVTTIAIQHQNNTRFRNSLSESIDDFSKSTNKNQERSSLAGVTEISPSVLALKMGDPDDTVGLSFQLHLPWQELSPSSPADWMEIALLLRSSNQWRVQNYFDFDGEDPNHVTLLIPWETVADLDRNTLIRAIQASTWSYQVEEGEIFVAAVIDLGAIEATGNPDGDAVHNIGGSSSMISLEPRKRLSVTKLPPEWGLPVNDESYEFIGVMAWAAASLNQPYESVTLKPQEDRPDNDHWSLTRGMVFGKSDEQFLKFQCAETVVTNYVGRHVVVRIGDQSFNLGTIDEYGWATLKVVGRIDMSLPVLVAISVPS